MQRTAAALACMLLSGTSLHAQNSTNPAMLPRDLVAALTSYNEEADIRVGALPPGLPIEATPPGGTLLGSVVQTHGSTTAFVVHGSPESALQELDARLMAARWRRGRQSHMPRGFVPRVEPRVSFFCRGDEQLNPFAIPRSGGSVLLRLYHSRQTQMCSEETPQHMMGPDQTAMPTLVAPRGARQSGGGGGGGNGTWESSTTLETTMSGAQLLAHYAAQAREQGWGASEEGHAGPASIQAFTLSDDTLGNWWGILTVMATPDAGPRFASFRIGRIKNP